MSLLSLPIVSRIRRNHGLEHATIHVLLQRNPLLSLVGRSDWGGYSIYGQISLDQLELAAREALARLQAGESELAVHPRCGTTLAASGVLSGVAAFVALGLGRSRSRFRWAYLPEALLAATAAAIIAQPLGVLLQQYVTTSGDADHLHIARVYKQRGGPVPIHRVETR
ncbi:MAG: hypothetical protein JSV81_14250 [Anaerolineales bacterium]|nr:MAG: hypothetical protein JSV81_14250 [Anaerolineales bacterium]